MPRGKKEQAEQIIPKLREVNAREGIGDDSENLLGCRLRLRAAASPPGLRGNSLSNSGARSDWRSIRKHQGRPAAVVSCLAGHHHASPVSMAWRSSYT